MLRIFLAHAKEDEVNVIRLYKQLERHGYKPWLDKKDLLPGQNWRDEIPKAIQNSEVFIACLSQRSIAKSGYVQREFRMALDACADKPPGSIYLIPLRLDNCVVPDIKLERYDLNLRNYQWVDWFEPDGFDRLLRALRHGFPNEHTHSALSDFSPNTESSTDRTSFSPFILTKHPQSDSFETLEGSSPEPDIAFDISRMLEPENPSSSQVSPLANAILETYGHPPIRGEHLNRPDYTSPHRPTRLGSPGKKSAYVWDSSLWWNLFWCLLIQAVIGGMVSYGFLNSFYFKSWESLSLKLLPWLLSSSLFFGLCYGFFSIVGISIRKHVKNMLFFAGELATPLLFLLSVSLSSYLLWFFIALLYSKNIEKYWIAMLLFSIATSAVAFLYCILQKTYDNNKVHYSNRIYQSTFSSRVCFSAGMASIALSYRDFFRASESDTTAVFVSPIIAMVIAYTVFGLWFDYEASEKRYSAFTKALIISIASLTGLALGSGSILLLQDFIN